MFAGRKVKPVSKNFAELLQKELPFVLGLSWAQNNLFYCYSTFCLCGNFCFWSGLNVPRAILARAPQRPLPWLSDTNGAEGKTQDWGRVVHQSWKLWSSWFFPVFLSNFSNYANSSDRTLPEKVFDREVCRHRYLFSLSIELICFHCRNQRVRPIVPAKNYWSTQLQLGLLTTVGAPPTDLKSCVESTAFSDCL